MWPNFWQVVYKEREMQMALSRVVDSCAQNFCLKSNNDINLKLIVCKGYITEPQPLISSGESSNSAIKQATGLHAI